MEWRSALICLIFISSHRTSPKAQLVYQRINETLIERLPLFEKRAICITAELIRSHPNETATFDELKSMIDNANFHCTFVGLLVVAIILIVLLAALICVVCLQCREKSFEASRKVCVHANGR
jgi:hypothetical protein